MLGGDKSPKLLRCDFFEILLNQQIRGWITTKEGSVPGVWRQKDFSGQVGRKENLQGQPEGIASALNKQKRGLMTGESSQWLQVNG